MAHWLAKTEPSTYAWARLVADKRTCWDGVRNAQARNNLAAMKKDDEVLIYHSGEDRAVLGIAKVARAAYPDPGADDPKWLCVDLVPVRSLAVPVPLALIKQTPSLRDIALVRQSRLSVMPLEREAFQAILRLGAGGRV
jgi:predicted RNA-binding protein with PUA-like domain